MKKLKLMVTVAAIFIITGCATHGVVTIPVKEPIENTAFSGRSIATDVFYSQPKPGIFSNGEIEPMKPIQDAKVSVGSSRVLARFKELFIQQLPLGSKIGSKEQSDYTVITELQAKDKLGPTYADYDFAATLGKKMLTFGLGSAEYTIIADFDVTYKLVDNKGAILTENTYNIHDEVDHERGGFDSFDVGDDLAAKLLEKHIVITMNQFFNETNDTLSNKNLH